MNFYSFIDQVYCVYLFTYIIEQIAGADFTDQVVIIHQLLRFIGGVKVGEEVFLAEDRLQHVRRETYVPEVALVEDLLLVSDTDGSFWFVDKCVVLFFGGGGHWAAHSFIQMR